MVLFTHSKIILLQCFSVFNFQLYPNGPVISSYKKKEKKKKERKKDSTLIRVSGYTYKVHKKKKKKD